MALSCSGAEAAMHEYGAEIRKLIEMLHIDDALLAVMDLERF